MKILILSLLATLVVLSLLDEKAAVTIKGPMTNPIDTMHTPPLPHDQKGVKKIDEDSVFFVRYIKETTI